MSKDLEQQKMVYGLFLNKDKDGTEMLGLYTTHAKACVAASLYIREQEFNDAPDVEKDLQIRALDLNQTPDNWYAVESRSLPF